MNGLKLVAGFVAVMSFVIGIAFAIYVFSWVFRILGVLFAIVMVFLIIGYIGWAFISEYILDGKDEGSS